MCQLEGQQSVNLNGVIAVALEVTVHDGADGLREPKHAKVVPRRLTESYESNRMNFLAPRNAESARGIPSRSLGGLVIRPAIPGIYELAPPAADIPYFRLYQAALYLQNIAMSVSGT